VVWAGKEPSGKPIVCSDYGPEDVSNLDELHIRAKLYGMQSELHDALSLLRRSVKNYEAAASYSIAIFLLVRRPYNLIGSSSPIEICPYVRDIYVGDPFPDGTNSRVSPAGHRSTLTKAPLSHLSGGGNNDTKPGTLIGAGSLGSKIALHMARAGHAPTVAIDPAIMSPHNAARHALIPIAGDMQLLSTDNKARLLSDSMATFAQATTRSEEHTSELQSRSDLVCRLLLEKKNNKQ